MGKKMKKPGKGKEKTEKKTAKAEERKARRESEKLSPEDVPAPSFLVCSGLQLAVIFMRCTLSVNPVSTSFFCMITSTPAIPVITTTLLKQCRTVIQANLFRQQILVRGLIEMATDLIADYIACDAPRQTISMLERLSPSYPTVFWGNALIRRAVRLGFLEDVLGLFRKMQRHGWRPDHYAFPFVLKACGELPSFLRDALVHAVVCANGFDSNVFVCNALVAMYGRCGALDEARQVFDDLCEVGIGDVVSWNLIVAAYVQGGDPTNALKLFDRMTDDRRICPDAVSIVNILPACASVRARSQATSELWTRELFFKREGQKAIPKEVM